MEFAPWRQPGLSVRAFALGFSSQDLIRVQGPFYFFGLDLCFLPHLLPVPSTLGGCRQELLVRPPYDWDGHLVLRVTGLVSRPDRVSCGEGAAQIVCQWRVLRTLSLIQVLNRLFLN